MRAREQWHLVLSFLLALCTCLGEEFRLTCAHGETFNAVTRRCACLPGYHGADCSTRLRPSCAFAPRAAALSKAFQDTLMGAENTLRGFSLPCAVGVSSCACLRECAATHASRRAQLQHKVPCFERESDNTSVFPEPGEEGTRWFDTWMEQPYIHDGILFNRTEVGPEMGVWQGQPVLPLSHCPMNCSFEGVCVQRGGAGACSCHRGTSGEHCELPGQASECLLACSDRGTCVRGVCICHPPAYGLGCSDSPAPPPAEQTGRAASVTAYVWQPPTHFGEAVEGALGGGLVSESSLNWDYGASNAFLLRLLRDDLVRTLDPDAADIHVVPSFTNHWGDVSGVGNVWNIERLVAHLNSTQPEQKYWERHGGGDFVVFASGDQGACGLPPHLRSITVATEYGQTDLHQRQPGERNKGKPCMRSLRGVVLPPTSGSVHLCREAAETWPGGDANANRSTLLYFSGHLGDTHHVGGGYSQGVRRAVANLALANASDVQIYEGRRFSEDGMLAPMRLAKFCLAPTGHGFGVRLTHAMVAGCVPVVIQDGVRAPLDDVLPYWRFSVRVGQRNLDELERTLRSVLPAKLAFLQAGVKEHHRSFIWALEHRGDGCGRAYEGVLESLALKAYLARGHIDD